MEEIRGIEAKGTMDNPSESNSAESNISSLPLWSKQQCAAYIDEETGKAVKGSKVDWQMETFPFVARSTWTTEQMQQALEAVHEDIYCSGSHCQQTSTPITGPRYRYGIWTDTDMCQSCLTSTPRLVRDAEGIDRAIPVLECLEPINIARVLYSEISEKLPKTLLDRETNTIYLRCTRSELLKNRGNHQTLPGEIEGSVFDQNIESMMANVAGVYLGTELADNDGKDQLLSDLRSGIHATRLIYLMPGADESPLTVARIYQRLEDSRPYLALSYTWKDTEFDGTAGACEFEHPNKVFFRDGRSIDITPGLRDALWRIRQARPEYAHPLWIDQLCIDQDDDEERGLQVDIMGPIFAKASRVVLWLGEEDESTEGALKLVMDVANRIVARQQAGEMDASLSLEDRRAGSKAVIDCGSVEAWYAVINLFKRLVLTRGWIIQELLLTERFNTEVRCGSHTTRFMALAVVGLWLSQYGELGTRYVNTIYEKIGKGDKDPPAALLKMVFANLFALGDYLNEGQPLPLSMLLLRSHSFETGDPRDRVFALLSVHQISLKGKEPTLVQADYTKSVAEVFTEATRRIIEVEQSLQIMSNAGAEYSRRHGLPSWVPDFSWSKSERGQVIYGDEATVFSNPQAAGDSQVSVRFDKYDRHLMRTSSYCLGRVSAIGEPFESSAIGEQGKAQRVMTSWVSVAGTAGNLSILNRDEMGLMFGRMFTRQRFPADKLASYDHWIARAVLRLMMNHSETTGIKLFDVGHGATAPTDNHSTEQTEAPFVAGEKKLNFLFFYLMEQEKINTPWPTDRDEENPVLNSFDQLLEAIANTLPSRNCFVMDSGHFGLGSWGTKIGDEVHIIKGANTPFICRKLKGMEVGVELHKLVGYCHVGGVMDGEALGRDGFGWKGLSLL